MTLTITLRKRNHKNNLLLENWIYLLYTGSAYSWYQVLSSLTISILKISIHTEHSFSVSIYSYFLEAEKSVHTIDHHCLLIFVISDRIDFYNKLNTLKKVHSIK